MPHSAITPSHSSSIHPSSGFHPTLSTSITSLRPLGNDTSTCSLQLLYTFSSSIILDQYQLRQLHNEGRLVTSKRTPDNASDKSKGKGKSINAELYLGGQLDLEAPLAKVDKSKDSYAIISIPMAGSSPDLPPGYESPSVDVDVEIPLHLRYQEPVLSRWLTSSGRSEWGGGWWIKESLDDGKKRQDIIDVPVSWPCVFWACETEQEAALRDNSPYLRMDDSSSCVALLPSELRTSLPSTSPIHPSTSHPYHYLLPFSSSSASSSSGTSHVSVPTGVLGDLKVVSIVNLAATWVGFSLLAWKTWSTRKRLNAEKKREEVVQGKKIEKKSQ